MRPDAGQVARNFLAEELSSPVQASWLESAEDRAVDRGVMRGYPDVTGVLADLVPRNVSPSNAISIASRLHRIKPERLANAVVQSQDIRSSENREKGIEELSRIRDEVLLWTDFLERKLTEGGTRGQDRVMLLAAAYLEKAPLELCIKAAGEFGPRDEASKRRFREGRSPRRRMQDVGVDVTADDRAAFDSRPGLAMSAIHMDWHHWADERVETRRWIERITSPGGVAAPWAKQIGERLLELSRRAVDAPFFPVLDTWTAVSDDDSKRISVVAQLFTQAAIRDELARETHRKLLDWAKRGNPMQRHVVAEVCRGSYGHRWPGTALVRLRHILAIDDAASEVAADALVAYAAIGSAELARVVDTVETWIDRYPNHPAGPRAFLALADADKSIDVLATLLQLAKKAPAVRDFLVCGWSATLAQPEVRDRAYQSLVGWSKAVHAKGLEREFTFGLLIDVRNSHEPVDAMSRFLYGSPDTEDPAIVSARFALANLRQVDRDSKCLELNCPVRGAHGVNLRGSAANSNTQEE
ncbi:hypothetical protein AB0F16_01135 [Streptomyces tanashiensis]|uniref:hypothetical protein n=1 Tax=Streptomyces tanashiensis TaxID=67367 RepID=UPI0033E7713A